MPVAVCKSTNCRWPNLCALLVIGSAVGVAYLNCDPMLAGSEPTSRLASLEIKPSLAIPALPSLPSAVPAPAEPGSLSGASAGAAIDDGVLRGKWALAYHIAMLEKGLARIEQVSSYTFTLTRQERVGGDLLPPQAMNVKLRHQPFSLYMKWFDGEGPGVKGRQLIYVQGQNDDKLQILPGGLAGRLSGTLSLALDDPLVTAEARHPANECGLKHLSQTLLGFHRKDLAAHCKGVSCELHDDQTFNDRPCYLFVSSYDSPERSAEYRKSAVFVDREWSIPVCIRNFTWGGADIAPEELDELTLLESYAYSEINLEPESLLADEDFSRDNTKYRMKR